MMIATLALTSLHAPCRIGRAPPVTLVRRHAVPISTATPGTLLEQWLANVYDAVDYSAVFAAMEDDDEP